MKILILIMTALIFTLNLSSQDVMKQPRYAIKTSPASFFHYGAKIGFDYAINTKATVEAQIGMRYINITKGGKIYPNLQFRYKRDLIADNSNLAGLYLAPGIGAGFKNGGDYVYETYATAFGDLGYQFAEKNINFEVFGGLGLITFHDKTLGTRIQVPGLRDFSVDMYGNSFNITGVGFRFGVRVGYQF